MKDDLHDVDRWITGESWVGSRLEDHLVALCDEIGPRWATSEAEQRAARSIHEQFIIQDLSDVHFEEFEYETWNPGPVRALAYGSPAESIECIPVLLSPPLQATASLVNVGYGVDRQTKAQHHELAGAIAILDSGYEPFTDPQPLALRLRLLKDAGALAAVVVNSERSHFLAYVNGSDWVEGDIRSALPLPAVGTTREGGARLRRLCRQGARLSLEIKTGFRPGKSVNTVADLPGSSWPEEQLVLTAHQDNVPGSPGAVDDASGISVVLEVARVLSGLSRERRTRPGCTIRFITFGAEEQMLQGSRSYVGRHYGTEPLPRLLINLDEIAAGPMKGLVLQFPQMREFLQDHLDTLNDSLGCHVLELVDKSGDGFPFSKRGIPTAFMWRWRFVGKRPDALYGHSPADTVEKVGIRDLKDYVSLTARLLLRLSQVPPSEWPQNTLDVGEICRRIEGERNKVMRHY